MKFKVKRTSTSQPEPDVEISTAEELIEFVKKNGCIIITPPEKADDINFEWTLEIYDDWRE